MTGVKNFFIYWPGMDFYWLWKLPGYISPGHLARLFQRKSRGFLSSIKLHLEIKTNFKRFIHLFLDLRTARVKWKEQTLLIIKDSIIITKQHRTHFCYVIVFTQVNYSNVIKYLNVADSLITIARSINYGFTTNTHLSKYLTEFNQYRVDGSHCRAY